MFRLGEMTEITKLENNSSIFLLLLTWLNRRYNHYAFEHYPSSCLCFETQRFGDWILSASSGKAPISEIGASSTGWTQQSRFYLRTETEFSLRNVVFQNTDRTMDNVQKHNGCTDVSSSQIFRRVYYWLDVQL
jgi:hypothetical protein